MPYLAALSRFRPRSLRAKLILGVVVPLAAVLSILMVIEHRREMGADLRHLALLASHSAQVVRYNFRHEMLEGDFAGINELMRTVTESKHFRIIYLLNPSGRVVFAPQDDARLIQMDNTQPGCQPCHRLEPEQRPRSVVVTAEDGKRVFRSMLPIENSPSCSRCHDPEQRLLGALLADISMAPLEVPLAASFQLNLLWSAGTIVITVMSIVFATNRLVIDRLGTVVRTLRRFGRGERGLRLHMRGGDEIASLGVAFNDMAHSVVSQESANAALSEEVQRHAERRRELYKKLIVAQEEERKRVARDLHDELGQSLAGLAVSLANVERELTSQQEGPRAQIQQSRTQITSMADRMHEMILDLRPSALDHLGLEPALRSYGEPMLEKAGVSLHVTSEMAGRLPAEMEIAVFRTVQEALTNVVRHGQATRVTLRLAMHDGVFAGEVVDDGRGFDFDKIDAAASGNGGFGLLGMHERIALCGGELTVWSEPGAGTRIRMQIPVPNAAHD